MEVSAKPRTQGEPCAPGPARGAALTARPNLNRSSVRKVDSILSTEAPYKGEGMQGVRRPCPANSAARSDRAHLPPWALH